MVGPIRKRRFFLELPTVPTEDLATILASPYLIILEALEDRIVLHIPPACGIVKHMENQALIRL